MKGVEHIVLSSVVKNNSNKNTEHVHPTTITTGTTSTRPEHDVGEPHFVVLLPTQVRLLVGVGVGMRINLLRLLDERFAQMLAVAGGSAWCRYLGVEETGRKRVVHGVRYWQRVPLSVPVE